jgi:hypothetical protein
VGRDILLIEGKPQNLKADFHETNPHQPASRPPTAMTLACLPRVIIPPVPLIG